MARVQGLLFGLATLVLVVVSTILFTKEWLPPLKSDRGAIDESIFVTLLVTGFVFIVTNLLLAFFTWKYQDAPGAVASYWHDNPKLEWAWTGVTAVIMFGFLFHALHLWAQVQSPAPPDAITIEVTGQQFAWNFRLPGPDGVFGRTNPNLVDPGALNFIGLDKNDASAADDVILPQNQLYLPEGRPVKLRLKSLDVIHSFFLPNFRVKQDAMPGMAIEIWFVPTVAGDYEIACAEHCGLGHYRMKGQVHVVAPEGFDAAVKAAIE
jgi:cytochrome c oxidase subunit 2